MKKSLQQWLTELENNHPKAIDLGLERVQEVASRAKLLNFAPTVVMVAGTNGKGSTIAALAALLRAGGLNVASYTSPHLFRFNERICINNRDVTDQELVTAFEYVSRYCQGISLTYFEFTTLAAFYLFQLERHRLDVILLEVGLGGRLDAVNIIDADLCILSTIGLDHQSYLGNTIDQIAFEKAGIIKSNSEVILGTQAQQPPILRRVAMHQNRCHLERVDFGWDSKGEQWSSAYNKKAIKLTNFHLPDTSVSLAFAAYTCLSRRFKALPDLSLLKGIMESLTMMGRVQQFITDSGTLVFDVAHNPQGANWLANWLVTHYPKSGIKALWLSMVDKDLAAIVTPFVRLVDKWYIGDLAGLERAASKERLKQELLKQGIKQIAVSETIEQAYTQAVVELKSNEVLVVFGSFYTVAALLGKAKGEKDQRVAESCKETSHEQ